MFTAILFGHHFNIEIEEKNHNLLKTHMILIFKTPINLFD